MCHAVDLNDQLAVKCNEVDNVPVDRMLAPELPSQQPAIA